MVDPYAYYRELCRCNGNTGTNGAGSDGSSLYDYYKNYCVCAGQTFYLGMRDLASNPTTNYPVTVYNVNVVQIGYALNKSQYISIWNSDPDNQAVGILGSAGGGFGFSLKLNSGQIAPPWVIGEPDDIDLGIYEEEYGVEYE